MAKRSKPRPVRVALVKAEPASGEVKANLRLLREVTDGLAGGGADVIVTSECFLDGYMVRAKPSLRRLTGACVSGPGDPAVRAVRRLARRLGAYVVLGASERDRAGTFRNAAYLIGRDGGHVGTYYKVMPEPPYAPGPLLPVFQTDFARVGIVICADRRWPENIRCLRLKGAEIILNPTCGFWKGVNTPMMRTRAYENGIPVCFAHPLQSLICLPDGEVGAVLESNRPAVLVHDIDLAGNVPMLVSKDKASSKPIQNRRPELYGQIVK